MPKVWIAVASVFAFLAVAMGAFGAHALRDNLSAASMDIYQTAVQYQMAHALAILAIAAWAREGGTRLTSAAVRLFMAGIVIFSGSLYALALTGISGLGAITPVGGLCFLAGWGILAYDAIRR